MQDQNNPHVAPNSAPSPAANSVVTPDPAANPAAVPNPAANPTLSAAPLIAPPNSAPISPVFQEKRVNWPELIAFILISLIAVTFIGLFIWKYLEWDTVKTDVDGQIDAAVAVAVANNTTKLENEFLEREKYPYKTFSGPADYGSLSFEYPKTWNVYIARDAVKGGDFEAYLNPGEVQPVGATTINALRVTIRSNTSFDNVVRTYDSLVSSGRATIETRPVGSAIANIYTGELQNGIQGIIAIFKLRSQTVLIQTDAALFATEYYKLLDTVNFVE